MRAIRTRIRLTTLACLGLGWSLTAGSARAAVLETSASLSVAVQEVIADEPASFSQDGAVFPAAGVELPLTASARVESTDLDGMLVAVAQGFAEFDEADLSGSNNPEELALEVACYSNATNVVYQVGGTAEETRTIVFTNESGSDLVPPEIEFRANGTREIESRFFVSGAILVWTPDLDTDDDGFPNNSLDGLSVAVNLSVTRLEDENDTTPDALLDTSISMSGQGETLSGPDTTGAILIESTNVDALVVESLDEASADALRAVADAGSLTIVLIPQQEHAYRYTVRANETFLLRAELAVDIRNVTDGSGIAVAIGRPFSQLTDFIEHALEGTSPRTVERSINAIVSKSDAGLVASDGTGSGRLCGALGIEVIPLFAMLAFAPTRRRLRMTGPL